MVLQVMKWDIHPDKTDEYFKWVETAIKRIMSSPGLAEFRAYRPDLKTQAGIEDFASKAWSQSQRFVAKNLNNPQSAEFPRLQREFSNPNSNNNSITIHAVVNAQNKIGNTVLSNYTITMKFNGGDWNNLNNWSYQNLAIR